MSTTLHLQQQGLAAILKAYFQANAAPATLYLALSTEATLSGNNHVYADITELATTQGGTAGQYARKAITSNSANWPVADVSTNAENAGDGSTHPGSLTWTNSASGAWSAFVNCFIIDSASGTGNIIAYGPLAASRTLQVGDSETIVPQVTLTAS